MTDYLTAHLNAREAHEYLMAASFSKGRLPLLTNLRASLAIEALRECAAILGYDLVEKSVSASGVSHQTGADAAEVGHGMLASANAKSVSTQEMMTAAGPSPGPAAVPSQEKAS